MSAPGTASRARGVCGGFVGVAEEAGTEGAVEGAAVEEEEEEKEEEEETRRRCR